MSEYVGQKAAGAFDPAGRVREDRSGDRARPEVGRGERGQGQAYKNSNETSEQVGSLPLFTLSASSRCLRRIKGVMEALKTADMVNRNGGGPRCVRLHWPDQLGCVNRRNSDFKTSGEIVPEDLEDGVADSEGDHENDVSLTRALSDGRSCGFVRRVDKINELVARCRKQFAPRTIVKSVPLRQPDQIARGRLLGRIQAVIFRRWYDALGWMQVIKHECGFYRPGRD